jgi:hypothetical protein
MISRSFCIGYSCQAPEAFHAGTPVLYPEMEPAKRAPAGIDRPAGCSLD